MLILFTLLVTRLIIGREKAKEIEAEILRNMAFWRERVQKITRRKE